MLRVLHKEMQGLRWSWPAWYVHVYGGHDPTVVNRQWSTVDVVEAYYALRVKKVLGG